MGQAKFEIVDGKIQFTASAIRGEAIRFELRVLLDENGQPVDIEQRLTDCW